MFHVKHRLVGGLKHSLTLRSQQPLRAQVKSSPPAAPLPSPGPRNRGSSRSRTRRAVWARQLLARRLIGPDGKPTGHVLLVDLDPQGNASTALGIDHRQPDIASVYELLLGEATLEEAIQQTPAHESLFCVPATLDLAGAEIELVSLVARENRLKNAINQEVLARFSLDYVFIDCPPSLGLLTVNAMVAAREVLIPIQCEYYALEGVGQLLRNIELVQAHLNRDLHVSTVLLTMYDGRTKLADQVAEEVRRHFGRKVLRTIVPRSVKVSEAPGFGMTIIDYDPGSRGAMSYVDAARELALAGAAVDGAPGIGRSDS